MEEVATAVTSVITIFQSVMGFITGSPLILALVVSGLVLGIVGVIISIFR